MLPVFGIELEFYIENTEENFFLSKIKDEIGLLGFICEKEKSIHQFEIKSGCYTNANILWEHFKIVKEMLVEVVEKQGGNVLFEAKPYLNRAGSALNIHINLLDDNNQNLFRLYNNYLIYSIGGLCSMLKRHMSYFVPNNNSYLRFKYPDINTPTTVSWGVNNRTAAIRIPSDFTKCRLEHRVPGADCDLKDVLAAIYEGVVFGIKNKVLPPKRVYGIASDPQYKMEKLI
ncbi:glutamine synthetase [Wolbachia pipientis]|uniref:Glutamine synthetase n=1 Tax=Wolbachia pipientis TaxID=955 RepID=A0A1E7QKD7_WOLPI|nr:glutamine synthetase [Wolbachia pipientis]OEY86857.1 glutamine synthetase [Wolbachia pipientis]